MRLWILFKRLFYLVFSELLQQKRESIASLCQIDVEAQGLYLASFDILLGMEGVSAPTQSTELQWEWSYYHWVMGKP